MFAIASPPIPYKGNSIHQRALAFIALMLLVCMAFTHTVHAQATLGDRSVSLIAILGNKASVSINDGQPKVMSIGQEHQGIKLMSVLGQEATFQMTSGYANRQVTLRIGQAPYRINPPTDTKPNQTQTQASPQTVTQPTQPRRRPGEIVFQRARDNHFYAEATINGKSILFMVDTGASDVSLSASDAQKLGINYEQAPRHYYSSANGHAIGYDITLPAITIQGVTLYNIKASVSPSMNGSGLLGQSYLRNFKITIKGDEMVLQSR
ncbi:MAG: retropepsin-like aspartic protease family protein [Saezia sp.]